MGLAENSPRRSSIWRRIRVSPVGVALGLVAFLVLSGTGAYAYWSVTASMQTSAAAGTLAITTSWSTTAPLGGTLANHNYSTTGEFTVKNTTSTTSTAALNYSVNLSYTGASADPNPLKTALDVTVWKKSGSCGTVGTPSFSGTWGNPPAATGTLVAGVTDTWCIRTQVTERSNLATVSGSVNLTPTLSATIKAGTNWTKTSTVVNGALQKTEYVYPSATPSAYWYEIHLTSNSSRCLDIRASGGAGYELIDYGCTHNPNQNFALGTPDAFGYRSVTPRHNQAMRWDNGGVTTVNSIIQLQLATSTATSRQAWQLQQTAAGVYQIVNQQSGLCIEPGAKLTQYNGETAYYQVVCNGTQAQRFTLETVPVTDLNSNNFKCKNDGKDVKYSWDNVDPDSYTFQAFDGSWKTIGTSTSNSGTITIDGTEPSGDAFHDWNDGKYDVRALDPNGNVVATGAEVKVDQSKQKLKCG